MSVERLLFLFLDGEPNWLRLADGAVLARGRGIEAVPPHDEDWDEAERVVLVVPGGSISVHWVTLPSDLAPAQARGAAMLMASEVSAEPVDTLHVALGPVFDDEEKRALALVNAAQMEAWLAEAEATGFDPDHVVSHEMLIVPPESGVRLLETDGAVLARGARHCFAAEAGLAELLLADEDVERIDRERYRNDLAAGFALRPVDLRQGRFAKRRRWTLDWALVRRLSLLAAAILLVTLLVQLILIARYSFAADALEQETAARARDVVPGTIEIVDPDRQLAERIDALGGGPGYAAVAGAVFTAVRQTDGAELQSMTYASGDGIAIAVAVPTPEGVAALQRRLEISGLVVQPGEIREAGGRSIGDFTVSVP